MNAFGIIYPQYWLKSDCEHAFPLHLNIVKSAFAVPKTAGDGRSIPPLLDCHILDLQSFFFKLIMSHNAMVVMAETNDLNPVIRMWLKVAVSSFLSHKLSEFIKLAEMATVQIIGSVEDERTFSNLIFVKSKVRNRLTSHLDL